MQLIKANEPTAAERVMVFPLVVDATDGITPETGEADGQPQYSVDGGANWTNTNGKLTGGANGAYQVQLTQSEVNQTVGTVILGRYKSSNTAEARAVPIQIVAFDPADGGSLGLSDLGDIETAIAALNDLSSSEAQAACAAALTAYAAAAEATLTAIKGAGWSAASDTLEKIRDAVDAIDVGGGVGVYTWDLTLTDTGGGPVVDCLVVIRNAAESAVISAGRTDNEGRVRFQLDPGSYRVRCGPKPGYDFSRLTNGTTTGHPWPLTVSEDASETLRCNLIAQLYEGYTFADLKRAVMRPLDREYKQRINEGDLELWVRAGDSQVNARLLWYRGRYTTASVSGQAKYVIWPQAKQIMHVTYDGQPLEPVDLSVYLSALAADSSEGTPTQCVQWGDDLYLYPTPDESGKPIEVWLLKGPPLLNADDDVPQYPPEYHRAIVDWALFIAFHDLGRPDLAEVHYRAFESQMDMAPAIAVERATMTNIEVVDE